MVHVETLRGGARSGNEFTWIFRMTPTLRAAAEHTPTLGPGAPKVTISARVGNRDHSINLEGMPVAIVGSRRDCQLPIESAEVSKVHCAIVNSGSAVYVIDLQSRTGTHVANQPIRCRRVRNGDQIRVASSIVFFQIADDGPDDADRETARHPLVLKGAKDYELTGIAAVVGRRGQCDVFVDDPDVSLAHALLFRVSGQPAIFDLGSRGGTFVNEHPVSFQWIANDDAVRVGGHTLTVAWDGPTGRRSTARAGLDPADPVQQSIGRNEEALESDLTDIEHTIAVLQNAVSSSRRRIDEQADLLKRRESEIAALHAELQTQQASLNEREATIAGRETELADRRAFLDDRWKELESQRAEVEALRASFDSVRQELEKREKAVADNERTQSELSDLIEVERATVELAKAELAAKSDTLDKRSADLDAARASLEAEKSTLAVEQQKLAADRDALIALQQDAERLKAELDQRHADQLKREAEIAAREEALSQREKEIEDRAAEIDRREQLLESARQEQSALSQKLARAKAALSSAAQLIKHSVAVEAPADADSSPDATLASAPEIAASNNPERPVAQSPQPAQTHKSAQDTSKPDSAPALDRNGRPIPVVNKASVAAEKSAAAAQRPVISPEVARLTPEQQERFRVLKRLSGKSDADVIQQVLAESKGKLAAGKDSAEKKAKRGWWS